MKELNNKLINIKNKIFEKKEGFIIIAIVIISLFALYYPGFIYTHDGIIHLYRTAGFFENIKNGDFFNRIYYNGIGGQGYGWGIFYPPLSAGIPALFMCLGFSLFTSEKLFIIGTSILAGLFSYKLFKELYKNNYCAMLTSIIYVLSPYKINQALIRGAMGEILIFTFLPLVFLGLIKIFKGEGKYKYLFIIGMVGVVYSHIISIVYTTLFAGLFVLFNYKKLMNKEVIKDLIISSIFIILLSLPILYPILQHQQSKDYIISNTETDVADRVVHAGQLISSNIVGKEAECTPYYSNATEMNYMLGPVFIVILLVMPFMYKKIKENNKDCKLWIYFILLFISIFMMLYKGIWNQLEVLDVIQFPWRILLYSVFFMSIISGYVLKELLDEKNKYLVFMFVVSYSLLFVFMIGNKVQVAKTINTEFDFSKQTISENDDYGTYSFSIGYGHEYLPNATTTEVIKEKKNNIDVISGDCLIENKSFEKNILKFDVDNYNEETEIELPLVYYHGYEIEVENIDTGKIESKLDYQMSEKGYIKVKINKLGKTRIKAKYKGTTLYRILDVIAIITAIVLIISCLRLRFKKEK